MLCRNALVTNVITARPDQTIGDALELLEKHGLRALPIVDKADKLLGHFNFDVVLSNLLPAPVSVEGYGMMDAHLSLDYLVDAEDHVAKELGELLPVKLSEVMDQELKTVYPDTALWEGIRRLFQFGSPLAIVDEKTGKLLGLLSVQSVMGELAKLVRSGG